MSVLPKSYFTKSTRLLTSLGFMFVSDIAKIVSSAASASLKLACYDVKTQNIMYRPFSVHFLKTAEISPSNKTAASITSQGERDRWSPDISDAFGKIPTLKSEEQSSLTTYSNYLSFMASPNQGVFVMKGTATVTKDRNCKDGDGQIHSRKGDLKYNKWSTFSKIKANRVKSRDISQLECARFLSFARNGILITDSEVNEFKLMMSSLGISEELA